MLLDKSSNLYSDCLEDGTVVACLSSQVMLSLNVLQALRC